jgi:translocation and assembly module TamA
LKTGDVLNQVKYEKAKEEMRTKALNLGYLGSEFVSHVIRISRAERKAEIELILQTGSQYLFGEVIWEGTQLYPIPYLERFLDFKPGEPYSYSKVYQTQVNLINSDRFASVNIRADKDEAREGRVPVRIQLEPSAPKRLRPGVGYSTDYGAKIIGLDIRVRRRETILTEKDLRRIRIVKASDRPTARVMRSVMSLTTATNRPAWPASAAAGRLIGGFRKLYRPAHRRFSQALSPMYCTLNRL